MTEATMNPTPATSSVILRPISAAAAAAIAGGVIPDDVRVAVDYPTEFSVGVAASVVMVRLSVRSSCIAPSMTWWSAKSVGHSSCRARSKSVTPLSSGLGARTRDRRGA